MRSLVFLIGIAVLLILALRRPFVSLSFWIWSGLIVPKHWVYGLTASISYNSIFALVTLAGYLMEKNKPKFKPDALFFMVVIFFIHTTVTSIFTINLVDIVWTSWGNFAKGIILFVMTCLILRQKHRIDLFVWAIVLSIGFLGFVEGAKFIVSAGGYHIRGPSGHILADNNHFATALSMVLPLIVYLISVTPERLLKVGLYGMLFVCVLAVLGTYSRGGLIGLTIVGGYFWMKSRRKLMIAFAMIFVALIASVYLPSKWFDRMDTMETIGQDSSFMTRITSWKLHTLLAMNRPFLGGGFKALEDTYVWGETALDVDKLNFISTPPPTIRGWAAHSIYFQVLGDHGFLGLFLFLWIIFLAFLKLASIEKYYLKQNPIGTWESRLAAMIKVSLVAYCVCGAALSLAYIELFYAILAMIICLSLQMKSDAVNDSHIRTARR